MKRTKGSGHSTDDSCCHLGAVVVHIGGKTLRRRRQEDHEVETSQALEQKQKMWMGAELFGKFPQLIDIGSE